MKKFIVLIFLAVMTSQESFLAAEDVKIRKIKIYGNEFTQESVIRNTLVELKEGDVLSREKVVSALYFMVNRLKSTGYFSSVLGNVVDSQAESGSVNVIIELEEGFLGRFGGGAIFGMAGLANFGGTGRDVILTAGTNIQSVFFLDRNTLGEGFLYDILLENRENSFINQNESVTKENNLSAGLHFDRNFGWGFYAGIHQKAKAVFSPDYQYQFTDFTLGGALHWDLADFDFSPSQGLRSSLSHTSIFPAGIQREEVDIRAYIDVSPLPLKLAFRTLGSIQFNPPAPSDRYYLNLSDINAVRKKFSSGDLGIGRTVFSGELRSSKFGFILLSFVPVMFEPALVGDAGYIWSDWSAEPHLGWAWGGGLRVYFENPVSLPLRFEYTVDNQGRGMFLFAAQAPF